jgi:hypothetical protein
MPTTKIGNTKIKYKIENVQGPGRETEPLPKGPEEELDAEMEPDSLDCESSLDPAHHPPDEPTPRERGREREREKERERKRERERERELYFEVSTTGGRALGRRSILISHALMSYYVCWGSDTIVVDFSRNSANEHAPRCSLMAWSRASWIAVEREGGGGWGEGEQARERERERARARERGGRGGRGGAREKERRICRTRGVWTGGRGKFEEVERRRVSESECVYRLPVGIQRVIDGVCVCVCVCTYVCAD